MIAQQQVQHGSGLALDRADPVDGAGPGVHGPMQDPAQGVTHELVAGLTDGPASAGHGHHTDTVCRAAARIDCNRGSCVEPLATALTWRSFVMVVGVAGRMLTVAPVQAHGGEVPCPIGMP
ncbi:MAG: hypothetical protein ACRDTA_00830 [Pseudonocardiaceae bacterium]